MIEWKFLMNRPQNEESPLKLLTTWILFRVGQDRMASTLLSSTLMSWAVMIYPKKVTSCSKEMHFLRFPNNFSFSSIIMIWARWSWSSFHSCYLSGSCQNRQPKWTNVRPNHLVHKPHKGIRGIWQTKWHEKPLIQATLPFQCCLLFIPLCNPNLIVATSQVHFREHTWAM